ncbi:hypothetical protein MTR_7g039530 [Medicago truncatula]|uniref:Uncharacterized protein n=1 Tax=Medicago truncatula TaxID=3880 RepID=A0A072TXV9_MEDTR|nr:hypothetical protein MTR_7g039530 [Medicago truncatula]
MVKFQQKIGLIPTTQHVPCSLDNPFSFFHVKIVQIYIKLSRSAIPPSCFCSTCACTWAQSMPIYV